MSIYEIKCVGFVIMLFRIGWQQLAGEIGISRMEQSLMSGAFRI